jgi:hypothetical protein
MARASFIWCVLLAAILYAQRPVPIGGRSQRPTNAVIDTPEIRKLVSEEESRQDQADRFYRENHSAEERLQRTEGLILHPNEMLPGHKEFIAAMSRAPSVTVPGKTRARVLEISKARCLEDGVSTVTFVKFEIAGKAPPGGTKVWVCTYPCAFEAP